MYVDWSQCSQFGGRLREQECLHEIGCCIEVEVIAVRGSLNELAIVQQLKFC